jgi:hypothetical protein
MEIIKEDDGENLQSAALSNKHLSKLNTIIEENGVRSSVDSNDFELLASSLMEKSQQLQESRKLSEILERAERPSAVKLDDTETSFEARVSH